MSMANIEVYLWLTKWGKWYYWS